VLINHDGKNYMDFSTWKQEYYVKPALELIPKTREFAFLMHLWKDKRIPLGLLHPKAVKMCPESPVTKKQIEDLIKDPDRMVCMPYLVAYALLIK
jgi:hypothetical protein